MVDAWRELLILTSPAGTVRTGAVLQRAFDTTVVKSLYGRDAVNRSNILEGRDILSRTLRLRRARKKVQLQNGCDRHGRGLGSATLSTNIVIQNKTIPLFFHSIKKAP